MQEWWSPAALAALGLPGLPSTDRAIQMMADRGRWRTRPEFPADPNGVWRKRAARGGGYEYRIDVLPLAARSALVMKAAPAPTRDERAAAKQQLSREERWRWFDGLTESKKAAARAKLEALQAVQSLCDAGTDRDLAVMMVAGQLRLTRRTLYNWAAEVHGIARSDWLAFLAPHHAGRQVEAACDAEAWEAFKGLYLRQEQPTAAQCYRALERMAAERGWTIPSRKTLERRLAKLDRATTVYFRQGPEALKRLYPAQQRDRTALHALEAVNADGHKWDVFVLFPGSNEATRPCMTVFQDLFSGLILSWRVDRSENKEAVRLAFGDLVETYGIPDHVVLDNGRNFASKWLTGGTGTRYRFKVKDEDPAGIFPDLGCEVHWTTPYSGQSKPIERAFRDFCSNIAKDVRLAGAWTGNTIANKPENYGSKAVPLETFLAVVAEGIAEHNARLGRRTGACAGKLSFAQAFAASYQVSPIRQATSEQQRKWLLASELATARKPDGAVHLYGNRYWCEALVDQMGRKVVARFDPDALHTGVHVYRPDGAYLAFAPCIEAVGFFDTQAGRAHARARGDFLRGAKMMAHAERRLRPEDVAAMLPQITPPEPPEAKVVRPVFGVAGNAALKVQPADQTDQEATLAEFGRGVRMLPGVAHIFEHRKADGAEE
ncbi:transposase domain-containing protein [Xanthobacter sp. KR7-225]|uniref:transposase domain-containing protein n=1 Tax=Xanthobacter sp. KR7-225 TaxID=3156613 RepID=UPI0032B3214B